MSEPTEADPSASSSAAERVRRHWGERPGWRPGRLYYAWFATFDGAADLHRLVDAHQRALRDLPGLDVIPRQWLHMTLQGLGYVDETDPDEVTRVVEAVRRRLAALPPIPLTVERARVYAEAVVLPVGPVEPVLRLREEIRAGMAEVLGPNGVPTEREQRAGFRPHVSIAYVHEDGPARPYVDATAAVRAEAARVRLREVHLVRRDRVLEPEWVYRWTGHTTLALAGT